MDNNLAIEVKDIKKKYLISAEYKADSLREKLVELVTSPINILTKNIKKTTKTKTFWALNGISFEVKKGEVIGIIGKNGAGKSTLLKILSRVTDPTSGEIVMRGKTASLLEVGTGFNAELTGRENIYLNGTIIGMKKKEIDSKFNDIVKFAGIGEFLDTPVKRYSSGMYVRLAFSVSAHLDCDILIVDEVLAVGDSEFQKKCLKKMTSMATAGKTVIVISHDLRIISALCSKTLLLDGGRVVDYSDTDSIIKKYNLSTHPALDHNGSYVRKINNQKEILNKVIFSNGTGAYKYGDDISFTIETNRSSEKFSIEIIIKSPKLESICYATNMLQDNDNLISGGSKIIVTIPKIHLASGQYFININCRRYPHSHVDSWFDEIMFIVNDAKPKKISHEIKNEDNLGSYILENTTFKLA